MDPTAAARNDFLAMGTMGSNVARPMYNGRSVSLSKETESRPRTMSTDQRIRIGILTVSDRASQGVYQDLGGPAIRDCLAEILSCPWDPVARVIPDEQPLIEATLRDLCDRENCCLVVTTGGTGPARRDVTPEATEAVCDKLLDGFGEQMRAVSLKFVPTAILSRQIAGIRGRSLIVNLPGKPSAIRDCLLAVFPAIPYCIDLIEGPYLTTNEAVVKAFRPKK
jgi:molybdopterin adenylyltransferase